MLQLNTFEIWKSFPTSVQICLKAADCAIASYITLNTPKKILILVPMVPT